MFKTTRFRQPRAARLRKSRFAMAVCLLCFASGCSLLFPLMSSPGNSDDSDASATTGGYLVDVGMGGTGPGSGSGGSDGGYGGAGGHHTLACASTQLLADCFVGDVGIEKHDSVILFEDFEHPDFTSFAAQWNNPSIEESEAGWSGAGETPSAHDMDLSGLRPATTAVGSKSLKMTVTTSSGPGTNTAGRVGIFRRLPDQSTGAVYVRYYIYHEQGAWESVPRVALGGYISPSSVRISKHDLAPQGDDFFFTSFGSQDDSQKADHGVKWPGMSWPDNTVTHMGNTFLTSKGPEIVANQWACIELMLKLNDPGAFNGELAVWLNDTLVQHIVPNQTWFINQHNGVWTEIDVNTGGGGQPFDGFDWRHSPDLKLNWLSLWRYKNLADDPTTAGAVYFDQVVVAKRRIGCMSSPDSLP